MQGSRGGLSDTAWIELGSGLAPNKLGVTIAGAFRLAGKAGGGRPAFDTGWMPNVITHRGVWSILARFCGDSGDLATLFPTFAIDAMDTTDIATPPLAIGLGIGTSADYFVLDALDDECGYAGRPALRATQVLSGGPYIMGAGVTRKAVLSAEVAVEQVAATGAEAEITEIGLFSAQTGPGDHMYAATTFTAVTISGDQAFTAFYSIGLSQTV